MKIGNKELSELSWEELSLNYNNCLEQENIRNEAATHTKFDQSNPKNVGRLPKPNTAFIELKNALLAEIKKRETSNG